MLAVLTAKKDQTKVVDLLLTKDPDITKTTDEGYTRDEKAEDRIGYTALHMAAKKGYINVATSLLNACRDKKACLNARANVVGEGKEFEEIKKNGLTPWMVAKIFRKEELADYLLRSGTDVTDADKRIVSEVKPGYNAYASLKNKLESYLLSQGNPWGK